MLKLIVLYTNKVGITDPEAMKRLKDFKRTLKPTDTSCDQAMPSGVEFVFHLGSWNRAFVSVSPIQGVGEPFSCHSQFWSYIAGDFNATLGDEATLY